MSSSDFDTGLSGSMCECGSMSGTLDRAEVRSATSESAGMAPLRQVIRSCRIYQGYVLQRPARITNQTDLVKRQSENVTGRGTQTKHDPKRVYIGLAFTDRLVSRLWHGQCISSFRPRSAPPSEPRNGAGIATASLPPGEPQHRGPAPTNIRPQYSFPQGSRPRERVPPSPGPVR